MRISYFLPVTILLCTISVDVFGQYNQYRTKTEQGYAVFYADYLHGRKTASGELYDKAAYTCAHKSLPFGTIIKVTREDDGRSVNVRVNDRGPFGDGMVVDLSRSAAAALDILKEGKVRVTVKSVGYGNENPQPSRVMASRSVNNRYGGYTNYDPYNNNDDQQPASYEIPSYTPKQQAKNPTKYQISYPKKFQTRGGTNVASTSKGGSSSSKPTASFNPATLKSKVVEPYDGSSAQQVPQSYEVVVPKGPASGNSNFSGLAIQIGAYSDGTNANRRLSYIHDKGLNEAYIVRKPSGSKVLHKIVVTGFNNRKQAERYLKSMKSQYKISGFVVNL